MSRKASAKLFAKPVDRAIFPQYYEVIAEPMDFKTLLERLGSRSDKPFGSFAEIEHACHLIFSNCRKFNPAENPDNAQFLAKYVLVLVSPSLLRHADKNK